MAQWKPKHQRPIQQSQTKSRLPEIAHWTPSIAGFLTGVGALVLSAISFYWPRLEAVERAEFHVGVLEHIAKFYTEPCIRQYKPSCSIFVEILEEKIKDARQILSEERPALPAFEYMRLHTTLSLIKTDVAILKAKGT